MITLNPQTTALVLIDLQNGIISFPLAPRTGTEVLDTGMKLAQTFRDAKAPVVLVNVGWSKDRGEHLNPTVDRPMPSPTGGYPPEWSKLAPDLAKPTDILVTKHQWGAFYGTDLDVQLRRRGIKTIVLGGIATNIGVESTARQALEAGYEVVIAEDATTTLSADMQNFAVNTIFPLISRVVKSGDVILQ